MRHNALFRMSFGRDLIASVRARNVSLVTIDVIVMADRYKNPMLLGRSDGRFIAVVHVTVYLG